MLSDIERGIMYQSYTLDIPRYQIKAFELIKKGYKNKLIDEILNEEDAFENMCQYEEFLELLLKTTTKLDN